MSTEQGTECGAVADAGGRRGEEPLWLLVLWLGPALVARARERIPARLVTGGVSFCGLVLLFLPLALWMAWSKLVLGVCLLVGCVAGLAILLLLWLSPEDRF